MSKRARALAIKRQPEPGEALPSEQRDAVRAACTQWRDRRGNLLPVLHAVQSQIGFVPKAAVALIASELNRSRAEVHGVISFYHDFRTEPPARHRLRLCRAEACQALGARQLEAHARAAIGLSPGQQASADGAISLEPVYCLGNCALGPAMMIDDRLCARVSTARFDQLLETLR